MNPYYGGANEIMNKYNGVKYDESGNVDESTFLNNVIHRFQDYTPSKISTKFGT